MSDKEDFKAYGKLLFNVDMDNFLIPENISLDLSPRPTDDSFNSPGLRKVLNFKHGKTYAELFGTIEIDKNLADSIYKREVKKLFNKIFNKTQDNSIIKVSNEPIDNPEFNLEDIDNMDFLSESNLENEVKQSELDSDYSLAIIDKSILMPILHDKTVFNNPEVKMLIKNALTYDSKLGKAMMIFNWMDQNLSYDNDFRQNSGKYRTAAEVFRDKKGVCGELSFLYIILTRRSGLKSNYVHVDVDYKGENVNHACAVINLDGEFIFVDPAYRQFDVKHKRYEVLDDNQLNHRFSLMRYK